MLCSSIEEDEYPIAKLCDFGLCHIVDLTSNKVKLEVECGTKGYIAPEMKKVNLID